MDALLTEPTAAEDDWEEVGFALTSVVPEDSGLERAVYVSSGEGMRHDVRVKVSSIKGGRWSRRDAPVVSVRPEPCLLHGELPADELEQIIKWIRLNEALILRHWNDEIGSKAFLDAVQPV